MEQASAPVWLWEPEWALAPVWLWEPEWVLALVWLWAPEWGFGAGVAVGTTGVGVAAGVGEGGSGVAVGAIVGCSGVGVAVDPRSLVTAGASASPRPSPLQAIVTNNDAMIINSPQTACLLGIGSTP